MTDLPCPICGKNNWELSKGTGSLFIKCSCCEFKIATTKSNLACVIIDLIESKKPTFVEKLETVDRWKTKDQNDILTGYHIKVQRWEDEVVIYSWFDGVHSWEDDSSFEDFENRFEKWY